MKKIALPFAGMALTVVLAAPANADTDGFLYYMSTQGEDTDGVEYELINLGDAICEMFRAGGTANEVWDTLNQPDPAAWIVGSVRYLCPEMEHVLD